MVSYQKLQHDFFLIFLDLSWFFLTLHLPKHPSLTLNLFPTQSSALGWFLRLVWSSSLHLSCISSLLDPTFEVFKRFWGFSKWMRFLQNFWVGFYLNGLKCSCIASHLHFNNVSCIIDACLLCWNHVCWSDWIGQSPWCFYYCMSHVHVFFMHMYLLFSICWYWFILEVSLSLSFG